jgi:hypothetical protein
MAGTIYHHVPKHRQTPESVSAAKAAMVAYRREHFTGPNQEVDEDGRYIICCPHCLGYRAIADTEGLAVVDITKHIAREHRPLSA